MNNHLLHIFFCILVGGIIQGSWDGKMYASGRESDKMRPAWIATTLTAENMAYSFKVTCTDTGTDLATAYQLAKKELVGLVEKEERAVVDELIDYASFATGEHEHEKETSDLTYRLKIHTDDLPVYIRYEKIDEYWEKTIEKGIPAFQLYTLYAIARKGTAGRFDDFPLPTRYGARGLVRGLVRSLPDALATGGRKRVIIKNNLISLSIRLPAKTYKG